jgi:hypothetical protein
MLCPESLRAGKRAGESMKGSARRVKGRAGAGGRERPLRGREGRASCRALCDPSVGQRKFKYG